MAFRVAVFLCAGWLSVGLGAQTIYIWEDEDGIQHFTDRKPVTDREVTVQRAEAEPQKLVDVVKAGTQDDPVWLFRNRTHGPVTVRVSLVEASNVVSEPRLPASFVLDGLEERELVAIGPLNEGRSWSYRFETSGVLGRVGARHEPDQPYRPPLRSEERRVGKECRRRVQSQQRFGISRRGHPDADRHARARRPLRRGDERGPVFPPGR